MTAIWSSVMIF